MSASLVGSEMCIRDSFNARGALWSRTRLAGLFGFFWVLTGEGLQGAGSQWRELGVERLAFSSPKARPRPLRLSRRLSGGARRRSENGAGAR
eukprot:4553288-Alexandrium_andersonii.AAC.1